MALGDIQVDQQAGDRLAKENATETQGLLALELSRLDDLCRAAYAVLDAEHPLISGGAVVEHEGLALVDHGHVLRAIDRLIRISERRCVLLGLNAPKQDAGAEAIVEALKQFSRRGAGVTLECMRLDTGRLSHGREGGVRRYTRHIRRRCLDGFCYIFGLWNMQQ